MLSQSAIPELRKNLLEWYALHRRDLPWRRTRDPYAIWISEIMLQQTRVAAMIPYYYRFVRQFPSFQALANANEHDLLASWAGLGYYHRARNMQRAARMMALGNGFPSTYSEIRALPGIGDYTAAAVASIAFDLPHAVVDGNVLRVLSRILNDSTDAASSSGRQHFTFVANALLEKQDPGAFNQALMELGAMVCVPKRPHCLICPVASLCGARKNGTQDQLPLKRKSRKSVQEERRVFWVEKEGRVLLWRRPDSARLMPGFWELPETAALANAIPISKIGQFRHVITFHHYQFEIWSARCPGNIGTCEWIGLERFSGLPLSTIARKAHRIVTRRSGRETAARAAASPK